MLLKIDDSAATIDTHTDVKVRNGHIKRLTDTDIQSSVLEIMGTNASALGRHAHIEKCYIISITIIIIIIIIMFITIM